MALAGAGAGRSDRPLRRRDVVLRPERSGRVGRARLVLGHGGRCLGPGGNADLCLRQACRQTALTDAPTKDAPRSKNPRLLRIYIEDRTQSKNMMRRARSSLRCAWSALFWSSAHGGKTASSLDEARRDTNSVAAPVLAGSGPPPTTSAIRRCNRSEPWLAAEAA